jgi:hypothetical protein
MFELGEWPLEIISCLLTILKIYLGEVVEAKIHGVESPCKFNFYILGIVKIQMHTVELP